MKALLLPLLFAAALLPGTPARAEELPLQIAPDLVVVQAEFGLLSRTPGGGVLFEPASRVPLVENQSYGWRLKLKTRRTSVAVREEFVLPAAPNSWGTDQSRTDVSKDGKTAVSRLELAPADGFVMNSWSVAEGDPSGRHTIRVFVEGRLVATFEFTVARQGTRQDTVSTHPLPLWISRAPVRPS